MALVSMPWAIFNRPSIQLGALKAYLKKDAGWLAVDTFHPYLEVAALLGTDLYQTVSLKWASEALYGSLVFPENAAKARAYFEKTFKDPDALSGGFDRIISILKDQLDAWIASRDWRQYQLAGFSVCFNQLLASLAAARRLKSLYPELPVVFGGSSCAGAMGASLFNLAGLDYVISGEGEIPLLRLCEFLARKRADPGPGLISRKNCTALSCRPGEKNMSPVSQVNDLSGLPVPDYNDYFNEMRGCFAKEPFIPVLPIEFSRGCWWRKCAFCNLNLQWRGYRAKKPERLTAEVLTLAEKHGCLDFTFSDNVLPLKQSLAFFREIAELGHDYHFFAEIRAGGRKKELATYRRGGLSTVQVGIESLSNSLLKKMDKGVSVIDNVAAMKNALECSIILEGNLIVEFPGSSRAEVEETLRNLDFVLPFHPLSIAAFFLGSGSPVDLNYQDYDIRYVTRHRLSAAIFPAPLPEKLILPIKEHRGDRRRQRKLWQPVQAKVGAWRDLHRQAAGSARGRALLSYRDGGNYLIIRQVLPDRRNLHHRLYGSSRRIYLFCAEVRTEDELLKQFNMISGKKLLDFLADLVNKRLLFSDSGKYLSLAIRDKLNAGC